MCDENDDDRPALSTEAMLALQEFYQEQDTKVQKDFEEDWQLSQFWYDDRTAEILALEALRSAGPDGSIACVSCPTCYRKLVSIKPEGVQLRLFEYDKRFLSLAGEDFVHFDFNQPVTNEELHKHFDLVLADPPFLSQDCLLKTIQTVRFLAKGKVLLCTGSVMEPTVKDCGLNLRVAKFKPKHSRNLANDFSCFVNYTWEFLNE